MSDPCIGAFVLTFVSVFSHCIHEEESIAAIGVAEVVGLSGMGFLIVAIQSFYQPYLSALLAAVSLSITAYSTSGLAILTGVVASMFDWYRTTGRLSMVRTRDEAMRVLKSLAVGLGAGFVIWTLVFFWNLYHAYEVFVWHPPQVQIMWSPQGRDFEYVPDQMPERITPAWLADRRQYVAYIGYPWSNLVPADVEILFQFPFPLDQYKITEENDRVGVYQFGRNMGNTPLFLSGPNFHFIGKKQYRNFSLSIPAMSPGGTLRLLVTLNHNSPDMVIAQGNDLVPGAAPTFPTVHLPRGEFVCARTIFVYGKQQGITESCSMFKVEKDNFVLVESKPTNRQQLHIYYELP